MCTKITEDRVVLPSLKDLEQSGNEVGECGGRKKNDVLYVDLGLGDDVQENLSVQSPRQDDDYSE